MEKQTAICDECGSKYLASTSKMRCLCPECASILYGYENCGHEFRNGCCTKCLWNGNRSRYIQSLLGREIKSAQAAAEYDLPYLNGLLEETMKLRQSVSYEDVLAGNCEITYLPTRGKTRDCLLQGLMPRLTREKFHLKEKSTLRKGTREYLKLYRREGTLVRIDCFVEGHLDCIFLGRTVEDRYYLFPFSGSGGCYPTYTYVSGSGEEYMVNGTQIIHERYEPLDENRVAYQYINYVPTGAEPILGRERGIFTLTPQLYYQQESCWAWHQV